MECVIYRRHSVPGLLAPRGLDERIDKPYTFSSGRVRVDESLPVHFHTVQIAILLAG
jgi:hypothetical protein